MTRPAWRRFVGVALGLTVVVFVLTALFAPPDPYTQLLVAGPGIAVALTVAYWVAVGSGE